VDTVADPVGDRAAVAGSVTAVVGMGDRPEESAGWENPTEARVFVLGVPVPCPDQPALRVDSIPADRRARALAESSLAQFCLANLNVFAVDVGLVDALTSARPSAGYIPTTSLLRVRAS